MDFCVLVQFNLVQYILKKTLYGCQIPVCNIYMNLNMKNIDPSVSHAVKSSSKLRPVFNLNFWILNLFKFCGAASLRILFQNSLVMFIGA